MASFAIDLRQSELGEINFPAVELAELWPRSLVRALVAVGNCNGEPFQGGSFLERMQMFVAAEAKKASWS